jgi:hypothetical protein
MNKLVSILVEDWRNARRWWSIRIHAFALTYLALFALMPVLSPQIAALLPSPLQTPVIGAYAVLGIVARLIAQKKVPDA